MGLIKSTKAPPYDPKGKDLKHGLSAEQFPVSAYVGSLKNLLDLKDFWRSRGRAPRRRGMRWRRGLTRVAGAEKRKLWQQEDRCEGGNGSSGAPSQVFQNSVFTPSSQNERTRKRVNLINTQLKNGSKGGPAA